MIFPFTKMHGAGNDFVLIDDRDLRFPHWRQQWLACIAARRTGIGCEGVVLLQPAEDANLRMRFFNPDGSEAGMCGNAARCVTRFAVERGLAPRVMRIQTQAGVLRSELLADSRVLVQMTPPCDRREPIALQLDDASFLCTSIHTGVPHAIVPVADLAHINVAILGRRIRYDDAFQPAGSNVDFVMLREDGSLAVRTYERGVEQETLACGTGMVAAAVVFAEAGRCDLPVDVHCASGDLLSIDGEMADGRIVSVNQTGPACVVYEGTLEVDDALLREIPR